MHIHWINRNYKYTDDKKEYTGSIIKHGEVYWNYDATYTTRNGGAFSWHWGTTFCHLLLEAGGGDGNDEVAFSVGIPWILAVWFHHTLPRWVVHRLPQHHYQLPRWGSLPDDGTPPPFLGYEAGSYPESREISLAFHHWSLWWRVWWNDDEWRSTDPWYRRGSFAVDDFCLGAREYLKEDLTPPLDASVVLPEGQYRVQVQHQRQRWWRKRWNRWPCVIVRDSWEVTSEEGIPFPGKGENSWDCGEDALHATSFRVATAQEACEQFAQAVLDYRRHYGGERCAMDPWPQAPTARRQEYEARKAQQAAQTAVTRRDQP